MSGEITVFFDAYREHCAARFPELRWYAWPRPRNNQMTWASFTLRRDPKRSYLWLDHKILPGHVDLWFEHRKLDELRIATKGCLEEDMQLETTKAGALIRLHVPVLDYRTPFRAQEAEAEQGMRAASRLQALFENNIQKLGKW